MLAGLVRSGSLQRWSEPHCLREAACEQRRVENGGSVLRFALRCIQITNWYHRQIAFQYLTPKAVLFCFSCFLFKLPCGIPGMASHFSCKVDLKPLQNLLNTAFCPCTHGCS